MESKPRTDFSTRLYLPGWWARAFNIMPRLAGVEDPLQRAAAFCINPIGDADEFHALAIILSALQKQVITKHTADLQLHSGVFKKHAATTNRQRRQAFLRTLQSVTSMQVVRKDGRRLTPMSLFSSQEWEVVPERKQIEMALRPTDLGLDLLLGYTNGYRELQRFADGDPEALPLLGERSPLSAWRALWMELTPHEQHLYLRLEQAIQWDYRWLHFDGVFSTDLEKLFVGTEGFVKGTPDLKQIGTILARLGQKLCDHGWLRHQVGQEFLAVSPEEREGLSLVWHVAAERCRGLESTQYAADVQSSYVECFHTQTLDKLIRLLSGPLYREPLIGQLKGIWQEMIACREPEVITPLATDAPVAPLPLRLLFFEWMIRQEAGHPLPLPSIVQATSMADLCRRSHPEPVNERLTAFAQSVSDNADYRACIQSVALSSLALAGARESAELETFVKTKSAPATPVVATPTPKATAPQRVVPKRPVAPDFRQHNIRQLASQELIRLQRHEPQSYLDLKKSYVQSLDKGKQRLLQDVQLRMQPELFDQHLKHSLIRYMVDNPAAWQGAALH